MVVSIDNLKSSTSYWKRLKNCCYSFCLLGWRKQIESVKNHFMQARSQDFFRAGKLGFFCLETLKKFILNDKFCLKMITFRTFFLQIRTLFSNFQKRAGRPPPPPTSSYVTVMIVLLYWKILIFRAHKYSYASLTLWAPTSKVGQTRSNNSSAICRQIVWVCLTILWGWRLMD